jgi:hypothetical protein
MDQEDLREILKYIKGGQLLRELLEERDSPK